MARDHVTTSLVIFDVDHMLVHADKGCVLFCFCFVCVFSVVASRWHVLPDFLFFINRRSPYVLLRSHSLGYHLTAFGTTVARLPRMSAFIVSHEIVF